MDVLNVVEQITGYTARSWAGLHPADSIQPDPILLFVRYMHDTKGYISHAMLTRKHSWRTVVKNPSTFIEALKMFFEVLGTGKISSHEPIGNWNPRSRITLSGTFIEGASVANYTVGDFRAYDDSRIRDIPVDLYGLVGDKYISFELLRDFARRLHQEFDGHVVFKWYFSGSWRWKGKYTNFSVTDDVIEYTATIDDYTNDTNEANGDGGRLSYRIRISRDSNNPASTFLIRADTIWHYISGGVPTSFVGGIPSSAYDKTSADVWVKDGRQAVEDFEPYVHWSIIRCFPALFHTQSTAVRNGLGNISKNFETFMETPGFMPAVYSVLTVPLNAAKTLVAHAGNTLSAIRQIVRVLAAGQLAYIFAVRPSLESAESALVTFLNGPKISQAESSFTISGGKDDYGSIPEGIRALVSPMISSPVVRYNFVFRTQIEINLSRTQTVEIVAQLAAQATTFGVTPEPVYIYNAVPFTFIIDWFIPLGSLIRDLQDWITSLRLHGSSVGHSVRVDLQTEDGARFHVFLRSQATTIYIDPPRDSWLQAPGVFLPAAIPLLLLAIL